MTTPDTIPDTISNTIEATTASRATTAAALRFITCGSVDDGKSTLIGRLLLDSQSILQDQLAGITRHGGNANQPQLDLAQLTDGLAAEREQGITIDVAWRYFSTARRKFIIGDAPGHEQYTRNMVTAASNADAAIVLVDATKLDWRRPDVPLLPQTKRHTLLAHLLRLPSILFAINKLDAVDDPALAYTHIRSALQSFTTAEQVRPAAIVPVSALLGHNIVHPTPGFAGYHGPALLELLHSLPSQHACARSDTASLPLALPVQWVQAFAAAAHTHQSRRILWGRLAAGQATPGQRVHIHPSGQSATIVQVLDHCQRPQQSVGAGWSAGIVLDRELDISRGDWLLGESAGTQPGSDSRPDTSPDTGAPTPGDSLDSLHGCDEPLRAAAPGHAWGAPQRTLHATLAWMDEEPAQPGRIYWALHGHRWIKARISQITGQLDIHTLQRHSATTLEANAIGTAQILLQDTVPLAAYSQCRSLGAMILVDSATHRTAAAVLLHGG